MGSIVRDEDYPTISVIHDDPDGELADTIKIWKGWANSGGLWAYHIHTTLNSNTSSFTDDYNVNAGTEYYYFAEIRQKDGQWIVTSPIWYTATSITSVRNWVPLVPVVTINAISKEIYASFTDAKARRVDIVDITGRLVFRTLTDRQDIILRTGFLEPGIYNLVISHESTSPVVKKLVIE